MTVSNDHYARRVFYSAEDGGWIAVAPELPGCSAFGQTDARALRELETAIEGWLRTARRRGQPVPLPIADRPVPGKFVLRLPKAQQRRLMLEAAEEGVSMNQYLLSLLAR